MHSKLTLTIAAAALSAFVGCTGSQVRTAKTDYDLDYSVSFEPSSHYIDVRMNYVPKGAVPDSVFLKMAVWSPGYYKIIDFPKYLTDFSASGKDGSALGWKKVGKNGWKVAGADTVSVSYRVFADEQSVVNSRVEDSVAFIAPAGVFMYVDGDVDHPADIKFTLPAEWKKISTALPVKDSSSREYTSPNFDVLFDSPLLIGNQYTKTISHNGHDYEFALETPKGFEESPIAGDFLKAVDEAVKMFGGKTAYDSYHLLLLRAGGGGLEHQASQADYTAGHWDFDTRAEYLSILHFLVHEYFHNYNVKAIRPIELGPFDYEKEVYTPMLWVSEGFSVYYEALLLVRAGIETEDEFLNFISDYIRTIEGSEGQHHMSLRQSSYDIWLNFFNMNANRRETVISYYDKGPVLGLLFDCTIKTMTNGEKSLDDLMRLLYDRYYEEKGRGFSETEFWQAAQEVAGGDVSLLRRYVDTTDGIDYESILGPAGLSLDRSTWTLSRK